MAELRYCKTDAGRREIQRHDRKLPHGMRSILLMIDGQRGEPELAALIASLHAPSATLQLLVEQGLIREQGDKGTYELLHDLMLESIRTHLKQDGDWLEWKLLSCHDLAEMEALLPEVSAALAEHASFKDACRLLEEARRLTGDALAE